MNLQQRSSKTNGLPALLFWSALWQILAMAVNNPLLLPQPLQVLGCLGSLAQTAAFWQTALASIGRVMLGVLTATALAVFWRC